MWFHQSYWLNRSSHFFHLILWFDWTGWTVGSIGLSGFIAIDSTGSMIQRTLRFHRMHRLYQSLDSVVSLDFVMKLASYKEFARELEAKSSVAVFVSFKERL